MLLVSSTWAFSQTQVRSYRHVYTTDDSQWIDASKTLTDPYRGPIDEEIEVLRNDKHQQVEGFGGCFNELGWVSLSLLSEQDRTSVMEEMFAPDTGACFTICRMPVGANDFARDWYSYNEKAGDFGMKNFSVANDHETLIPYIKSALYFNKELKIWASPWCPPSWMKKNGHYACIPYAPQYRQALGIPDDIDNGLTAEKAGREGTDMMIQEPHYLDAYALYFQKFVEAYRNEGISIFGVMPQNEFNSPTVYPSCCWTANGLANFIGRHLGPAMQKVGVDVMLGTMERSNYLLVDSILKDNEAGKYIKAAGFQWAGKGAIRKIRSLYPGLKLVMSEQECGDGKNDWKGMLHSWDLMKFFFDNGVSFYDYWNISLKKGGVSRWGWRQNSLVVVDPQTRTFRYTPEYYLMKHFSHFIKPGAFYLTTEGYPKEVLAFENPDKSIVFIYMEKNGEDKTVAVKIDSHIYQVPVKANSINTFVF